MQFNALAFHLLDSSIDDLLATIDNPSNHRQGPKLKLSDPEPLRLLKVLPTSHYRCDQPETAVNGGVTITITPPHVGVFPTLTAAFGSFVTPRRTVDTFNWS